MANIDLNSLFTKKFSLTSPVDSDINLNRPVKNDILYSDVKLDLVPEKFYGESLNSQKTHNDLATIVTFYCGNAPNFRWLFRGRIWHRNTKIYF